MIWRIINIVESNAAYLQDDKNLIAYNKKSSTDYEDKELFAYAKPKQVYMNDQTFFYMAMESQKMNFTITSPC